EQARAAEAAIVAAGYDAIGIDHFAKPADSLAVAAREGRLHRNFQGYTDDAAVALLGFGASAIGQLPQGYVQNVVPAADYKRQVDDNGTAIAKGIALMPEDRVRAYVIERLMCDFAVSRSDLVRRFGREASAVLREMQLYCESDADGLAKFDGEVFRL